MRLDGWPNEVIGNGLSVPVSAGRQIPYAFLDNAASTPALCAAAAAVDRFLPWYSSVHRGTGFKSQVATAVYEEARQIVRPFVGAHASQSIVFIKNTTEGLNRLARLLAERQATIFMSIMEHHANMLTWRYAAPAVRYVHADLQGVLDEDDLVRQLRSATGAKLVAIAGAYNITGYAPPIHRIAALAHENGAEILIDGAQLVPHRRVHIRGARPGEEIDYLVFSAHKLYAPFGSGILIAPSSSLRQATPGLLGGGIVELVTLEEIVWNSLPDREEAGTPNVVGAVALIAAMARMTAIGRQELELQEQALTSYLLRGLQSIPGLRVLGPGIGADRVGVVSFDLEHVPHSLVAAFLAHEHGIGVRNGCFCAHPAILHLLDLRKEESERARDLLRQGIHGGAPGAVRVSLGLQNTRSEVDRLLAALRELASDGPAERYRLEPISGEYVPEHPMDEPARLAAMILGTEGA